MYFIARLYLSLALLLSISHDGKHNAVDAAASSTAEDTPCRSERAHAQMMSRRPAQAVFNPECKEDGSFADVQCHTPTGYCWCVNEAGKPIPGSSVRNKRPNCNQQGKPNTRRRSSRGRKERKGESCGQSDRTTFNENLLKIFLSEYNRLPSHGVTTAKALSLLDSQEKRAIEWKFTELDRNGDHDLDKKELQALRRMLKKVVRPRSCARTFSRACDQNLDRRISRSEWSLCLGVDMNNEQTEQAEKEEPPPEREAHGPPLWNRQITTLSAHARPTDANTKLNEDNDASDCPTDRQFALEQQRNSEGKFFVPECTLDGKYNEVQCFKPTGYCWCVDPDTGKTIKGTSVSNTRPDCKQHFRPDKPIKGCPDRRKQQFLSELIDVFLKDLAVANHSSSDQASNIASEVPNSQEKAAQKKFKFLDTNANQVIDKSEWKDFKNEVKKRKTMRKCGRNFLKYCDDNNDKRVTEEEWIACLGLKEPKNANPPSSGSRRPGKNPLDLYLRHK